MRFADRDLSGGWAAKASEGALGVELQPSGCNRTIRLVRAAPKGNSGSCGREVVPTESTHESRGPDIFGTSWTRLHFDQSSVD